MGFFDDDPFENIVREFFGESPIKKSRQQFIKGEEEDRIIDFVEDEDYVYIVFELPGYSKKDISISVKGNQFKVNVLKKENDCEKENVPEYLRKRLSDGLIIKKILPKFINTKNFKISMKNGVLEIIFAKK